MQPEPDTDRDGKVSGKIARAGVDAARRRFSPEFMNRIDKTVVFNPLGKRELRSILGLELDSVQERIFAVGNASDILCNVRVQAREFLLMEGTDSRYGARHLKRAVERLVVQPVLKPDRERATAKRRPPGGGFRRDGGPAGVLQGMQGDAGDPGREFGRGVGIALDGAPGETRTPDPLVRSR